MSKSNKHLEENDKEFEQFTTLVVFREALEDGFRRFTAEAIKLIMKERGVDCDVRINVVLPANGVKIVDIFCKDPLIVGVTALSLRNIEEARNQLEKLNSYVIAAEKFTNKKIYLKVLAAKFVKKEAANFLKEISEKEGIYLILGREIDVF